MNLEVLTTLGALRRLEPEWRELSLPTPMQSPSWLVSWWEAFGEDDPSYELATLAVRDADDRLVGLAPFYIRKHPIAGPTLRLLGDGRASTDHHTLLCRSPEDEPAVVRAVAEWMIETSGDAWRRVRFEALDADDRAMNQLERLLDEAGLDTQRIDDLGSFPVQLASEGEEPDWDAYLATLSKNRRKRLRRWLREKFDTWEATVRVVHTEADREATWPLLVDLHRERRVGMGELGVFDEPRFNRFHQLASKRLLEERRLYLAVLELNGEIAAIEYSLQDRPGEGKNAVYAYQGGIATSAMDQDAGHLSLMALVRHALGTGRTHLDLLRGDEPYKLSWGATHRPATTLHARPADALGSVERWVGDTYRSLRDRRLQTSGFGPQDEASSAVSGA